MEIGNWLIGGGIGVVLVALIEAIRNRRKLGADTVSVLTKAASELVQPLTDRMHELDSEVDRLKSKVQGISAQLDRCRELNRAKDIRIAELLRGGV